MMHIDRIALVILPKSVIRQLSSSGDKTEFEGSKPRDEKLELLRNKRQFWEKQREWEAVVDFERLTPKEVHIFKLHKQACEMGELTYHDPDGRGQVFTSLKHFSRGKCCGSACRHCPYHHEAVKDQELKLKKRFNSAFYADVNQDVNENGGQNSSSPS